MVAMRSPLGARSMTGMGHEDAFPQPTLSARSRISQRTFARTRGNGQDAPIAVVPAPRLTAALVTRMQTELQLRLLSAWPIIKPQINH